MQGEVKLNEASPVATVRMVRPEDGFGFIETEDGREIYFHRNSVVNGAFEKLKPGSRVVFAEDMGEKGPQATTVKLSGKHAMR